MKCNLLLYKTKWGATKQYAEWIKEEEPSLMLADIEKFDLSELANYSKIVIGSRTYMGQIEALDFMKKNWEILSQKKLYLFSVGMLPSEHPDSIKSYQSIPEEIRASLAGYTKLMGKIDPEKLTMKEKLIAKVIKPAEVDQMERKNIEPIVSFLKGVEWKLEDATMVVGV